jgi:hypothetical protein
MPKKKAPKVYTREYVNSLKWKIAQLNSFNDLLIEIIDANRGDSKQRPPLPNPSILDRANQTGGVIVCDWETYR